ncbi:MAG TPA: DNA adenine methylase [Gaiellales bacterium]|nr:DNA adenine methylase [Gaiellales bacterium]
MIKYLGSKRTLVPVIGALAAALPARTAVDLFAGTTRVGQELRRRGLRVVSNDVTAFAEAFGQAYIAAGEGVDRGRLKRLLAGLAALPPLDGYATETFCRASRYFQPQNGMRIDAVRAGIDRLELDAVERGLLLTSLVEAADRVDSTCGVQMAYLKRWAPRAANLLELREPAAIAGPAGSVTCADANELAAALTGIDLAYVDPPYNQHSYLGNYHVWETLVRGDEPEHYGVACKRADCRTRKSAYNSRRDAWAALDDLIGRLPTPWIVVSLSDEGFHDPAAVEEALSERGHVGVLHVDFKRYVGAQIGIHNPAGERVGQVSHLRNTEWILVCGPDRRAVDAAIGSAPPPAVPRARTGSARSHATGRTAASRPAGAASATRGRARA